MIYIEWFFLVLSTVVADLLGTVMVPLGLLFCNDKSEHMPKLFWPWDNATDGINGDAGWRGPKHANGRERGFWWRWWWLAIRNAGTNYSYLCGYLQRPDAEYTATPDSDPLTSNQGHAGFNHVTATLYGEVWAFEWYYVKRWAWFPSKCLRIRLGWKMADNIAPAARLLNLGTQAQIVSSFNPLMTFTTASPGI